MRFAAQIAKDDYTTIGEQINAHRSTRQQAPLKASSIAQYCSNYNILSRLCDYKSEDPLYFIEDYDRVHDALLKPNKRTQKTLTDNSRRNYLNSVIIMSQTAESPGDVIQKFVNDRDALNQKYNDIKAKGQYSEDEEQIKVSQDEIDEMLGKIKKELKGVYSLSKSDLSANTYNLLQFFTMMSLYKEHRLRNDFASLNVVGLREFNHLTSDVKQGTNFLVVGKTVQIVLYDYKTKKNQDPMHIDITNKELLQVVRKYIGVIGKGVPLFTGPTGHQMTSNQLTTFLQKYTFEYLGKRISTRMLRKIFYSEKYGHMVQELKQDAKENLHSVGVALDIYAQADEVDDGFVLG